MKKEHLKENSQFEILYDDNQSDSKPNIEIRYYLKEGQTKEDFENDWEKYSDLIKLRVDSIILHNHEIYSKYKFTQNFIDFKENKDSVTPVYYQTFYDIKN